MTSHRDGDWNDAQPIYLQIRDLVVARILEGAIAEGDPLPSVRSVAADYRVNPLTVLKGYQTLVDQQLVETRRGLGMFVMAGARARLREAEREKFLAEQWPRVYATIRRLGLDVGELLAAAESDASTKARRGSARGGSRGGAEKP
jgi:GntR family transcriptional regulator